MGARSNPLVPMGYTSLVSLKAARGEWVQVTPCGGRLFRCWSTYATTDRASYTSLPGWYFVLIYNAMEVVGAAPHAKCIEFDGRRSLIAGAFCNCVVQSNLRKRHYFVEVVVGVRLPIFLQCDGIING